MNLIDAVRLYCHVMQQAGGGLVGRKAASDALHNHHVHLEVVESISRCVTNEGAIISGSGSRFAITQIADS